MRDETAIAKPAWELRRELRPGTFRTYAHGYWRPFVVVVLGRVLIGKRALKRGWDEEMRRREIDRFLAQTRRKPEASNQESRPE